MPGANIPPWAPLWLPPGAFELNPYHPLSQGLVGFWPFAGSGKDYSVYNNAAAFTASPGLSAGLLGPALSLNGSSQYAQAPAIPAYNTNPATAWCQSCWFFPTVQQDGSLVAQIGPGEEQFDLRYDRSGTTTLDCAISSGVVAHSATSPSLNTWHHGLASYNGSNLTVYLDGAPGTPVSVSGSLGGFTQQPMQFGHDAVNSGQPFFSGSIANAMVYNRGLSVQEVIELYRSPFSMLRPVVQRQYYQAPQTVSFTWLHMTPDNQPVFVPSEMVGY